MKSGIFQSYKVKIKRGKDAVALDIIAYGFCGIIALVCLVPFIMIVSGSFSSESAIIQNGFSLLPQDSAWRHTKPYLKILWLSSAHTARPSV